MADFGTAEKYVAPAREAKPSKYIDAVKQFTDLGVDTVFPVTVKSNELAAEKLEIQRAVIAHGFSARTVSVEEDGKGTSVIKFRIRPARKPRGEGEDTPEDEPAEG